MLSKIDLSDWNALCDLEIMWQKILKPVCNNLRNKFIQYIPQRNGAILKDFSWALNLRNKCDESVINGRWN